ncbi:RNA helicase, partial [Ascoidea rubescens DSM 1968]
MLICAPTGAGKTDIALLTILHTINSYLIQVPKSVNKGFSKPGVLNSDESDETDDLNENPEFEINLNDFKIIYIAPLKALASEIVSKFSKKLNWLNIKTKELTGDMQLTKNEILQTQIIVTTPEKWDVITRKSNSTDNELISKVKLLIIDEVHLLHEDRGSVLESLVARTLRQVESTQSMIRIVGLSATLPNYIDVADFLGVNRNTGMFYFDQFFRPVPLKQEIIGCKGKPNSSQLREILNRITFEKLIENIREDKQVMIFVTSRKETLKTSRILIEMIRSESYSNYFNPEIFDPQTYNRFEKEITNKNKNNDLKEIFLSGFGTHHAGMLRSDRNLVEKLFLNGFLKVLVCTATLAWGVNLPASVVIIKGTQVYDSKNGGYMDMGISDVIQIFGRAGRPQFEKYGSGILLTSNDKLDHYINLLTQQHPIESKLGNKLVDNLNAEISLGTVTNINEGIQWLGYTYLFVRMKKNPLGYGIDWKEIHNDPQLINKRREMIIQTARRLHSLQMIVFDEKSGSFISKDLGRVASDFYLLNDSIEIFNQMLNPNATEADVLSMITMSSEFDNIKFREEEANELTKLLEKDVYCQIASTPDSSQSKTNILLQAFISKASIQDSALISDCNYVSQNSIRICRALFQIGINRFWGVFSRVMLSICKSIDKRIWYWDHPLSQFELPQNILKNIRAKNASIDTLRDMTHQELGDLVHNTRFGKRIFFLLNRFPVLHIDGEIFPITANVMRVHLNIECDFIWDDKFHSKIECFHLTVEESDNISNILYYQKLIISRKNFKNIQELDFMIPLADPLPPQIIVRAVSDTWIGSESVHSISFQHLIRPHNETLTTKLLRLQPLPISALHNSKYESIYDSKFNFFNPMQTMVFHTLYHSNSSVFVGSPTGSGKTVVAELSIWHAFNKYPDSKIVYIAPMKALVRERVDDWRARITPKTGYKLVELTGDSTPDVNEVREAKIIVTTPEKFDGISRNWQTRKFVQQISLVIMDEIHLLASDRGPILEMIVSRMNYISSKTKMPIRLLGMSTAVSNAMDMASWLGIKEGLFNFPQSVRPVPLQMYIDGFPDNLAFCPLMKTMNKPAFMAIKQHSPNKPVLIFVASRRQTRLTALDLIHLCGLESNPRRFLKVSEDEIEEIIKRVKDDTLKLSLQFGIGLHHAGLVDSDRRISHGLFQSNKIQILVATSTLAWGVNLPAHLVIIKGTQFFDAKIEAYRDMDLTDVLQMMGRAGRPGYDTNGIAIVYTKENKKLFYKHFLNIGFPVESSLHKVLDDHIGAEISSGTIKTREDAIEFLSWTFLYRRAHHNPTYYGIEDVSVSGISSYLGNLIDLTINNLRESNCIKLVGDKTNKNQMIESTPFLDISSYYYLSHKTIRNFLNKVTRNSNFEQNLILLSEAVEYNELPTRHGEELINHEMSLQMRYSINDIKYKQFEDFKKLPIWDPHIKTFLLLQAYFTRIELPIADYSQDTVTVLDQALRIIQAYIDISSELGYLSTVLKLIELMQSIKQGSWFDDNEIGILPGMEKLLNGLESGENKDIKKMTIKKIGNMSKEDLENYLINEIYFEFKNKEEMDDFFNIALSLPTGNLKVLPQIKNGFLEVEIDQKKILKNMKNNKKKSELFQSYCSKFPKFQKESWFFIICDFEIDELYLIKRCQPQKYKTGNRVFCKFEIPKEIFDNELDIICVNDGLKIEYRTKHLFI